MPAVDASDLIEATILPELRMLATVDPQAARTKSKRMARSEPDFLRGCLSAIVPWLARKAPADGHWTWSIGDAHVGNFSTLAVGRMDRDGIVPVTFGVSDIDDEGASPWSWDLLRLMSSLAVLRQDLPGREFRDLCTVVQESYAETIGRLADGDPLAARIDRVGLPDQLRTLIDRQSGEVHHKRFIAEHVGGTGRNVQLRRSDDLTDDPRSAPSLREAWEHARHLPTHELLDVVRRRRTGGLSSLGRRRWLLLVRETKPIPRLRLVELKERAPSALQRVLPVSPFAPWAPTGEQRQPVLSTMGGDPFQRLLHTASGALLARTRCHSRTTLDITKLDAGDLRRVSHLHGQLIASFHWQGLRQIAEDAPLRGKALARIASSDTLDLPELSGRLARNIRKLAKAFRKRTAISWLSAPLLRKPARADAHVHEREPVL